MARPTVFALGFAAATSLAMLLAGCPATSNGPFFEVPDAALDATTADASGPAACVAADGQCLDEAGIDASADATTDGGVDAETDAAADATTEASAETDASADGAVDAARDAADAGDP